MGEGLFDVDSVAPAGRGVGRVERATLESVRAAGLESTDAAAAALAVELARAVDVAATGRSPAYAVSTAARELRECLIRLRLDPTSRGASAADPVSEFLASLATPTG